MRCYNPIFRYFLRVICPEMPGCLVFSGAGMRFGRMRHDWTNFGEIKVVASAAAG
jgi:hypothetical protein